jgi:hypothetical protein
MVIAAQAMEWAVKRQINGNKNHGWGMKDQHAVIGAIALTENCESLEEIEAQLNDWLTGDTGQEIMTFLNASATRQKMEAAGLLNAPVGEKRKRENKFASFV